MLSGPTYFCPECRDHLTADLREIARRYPMLDAAYGIDPDAVGGGGFGTRPPGRVDIMVARDERSLPYRIADDYLESEAPIRSVARTLETWAGLIAETRGEETEPPKTVAELADWLARRVEYIARWPEDGPALALDMRRLRNQLRSQCGEPNPKPSAFCIRFEPDADGKPVECGAAIFMPPGTGDRTSPVALWCTGPVQHRYTGTDIIRLTLANEAGP